MATGGRAANLLTRPVLAALTGTAIAVTAALPAYAQPTEIPDPGARPAPDGAVTLPDGSAALPPTDGDTIEGPLSAEIAAVEIEIDRRTARLRQIEPQRDPAEAAVRTADLAWRTADTELTEAQASLDELVDESYIGAAALPPELFLPELRGLSAYAPVPVEAPIGVESAARELVQALEAERVAAQALATAREADRSLEREHRTLERELAALRDERQELRDRNAALLIEIARARQAAEQRAADNFPVLAPVAGFEAGEDAIRAVEFALRQLGKPYLWGAEGPNRYDCSGLMWDAYRFAGHGIPRVAADQYFGTRDRLVTRSAAMAQRGLLPGDLVFFNRNPGNWQTIHHVGMYLGNGRMVHAPNRNEVVQISPIWWSQFFAATRVVEAERVTSPTPSPAPGPAPTSAPLDPPDPEPTDPDPEPTDPDPEPTDPNPEPTDQEPTTVTVPSLEGMTAAKAEAEIRARELLPDEGNPVISDSCEVDLVVEQDPPAGEQVEVGTIVTYRLCEAPPEPDPTDTTSPPTPEGSASPSSTSTPSPTPS